MANCTRGSIADWPRVLVVDDDPVICDVIATALSAGGFNPVTIDNPRAALRTAREIVPDAITLDLEMPGMDGRRVLRRLRADNRTSDVPVVVISGNCALLSASDRLLTAAAIDKPFNVSDLLATLGAVTGGGHAHSTAHRELP